MWVTLCAKWQGFKLTMTTKTLIGWFAWENSMCWPTSPTTWSFRSISLQWHFFYKDSIPPEITWFGMVACCEDFVVKSRVHAAGNQTCAPLLAVFELRCFWRLLYIWVLILETASSGAHFQFTFAKVPPLGSSDKLLRKVVSTRGKWGRTSWILLFLFDFEGCVAVCMSRWGIKMICRRLFLHRNVLALADRATN